MHFGRLRQTLSFLTKRNAGILQLRQLREKLALTFQEML